VIIAILLPTTFADNVYLTVGYCTSAFSGLGALIKVSPIDGSWEIMGKFKLPGKMGDDCPVLEDSNMFVDTINQNTYLSFGTEWGLLSTIDDKTATIFSVPGTCIDQYIFDGFTNFAITSDSKKLRGLTEHVTKDGFCSDGCFRFGEQDIETGRFHGLQGNGPGGAVPFKECADITKYLDKENGVYYT